MNILALNMAFKLYTNRQRGKKASRPVLGSILGIALSMVPLVVVLFMSDGMIRGITDRFIETGTYHIQLRNFQTIQKDEKQRVIDELKELAEVNAVFREHRGMGMAYTLEGQSAVTVRGLEQDIYNYDEGFKRYLSINEGSFDLSRDNFAIIGGETARKLNLSIGDEFRILTGKTLTTGKYIPKISRFIVKGIFSTGYQDLDKMWVLIPYERAVKILQDSEAMTFTGLKIDDPYGDLSTVMKNIKDILPGRWGIYSWKTLNRSQQSNFQTTRSLLVFIMVLIVLVAVMNISSSMVMLVMENEQSIGIQKCMGLSPRTLSSQYVITAAMAGASGSLIGILGGSFISVYLNEIVGSVEALLNGAIFLLSSLWGHSAYSHVELLNSAYYLNEIPVEIRIDLLLIIFLLTVLLSIVASFVPVRKAGSIKPLDILRKH
ncbi:MAG: hypothetical protein B6241_05420 [Spirochaetaceae bacterium 4572_59]|nr:MAG: hypothetical protein B6241_05420 [Spirochaetaceae bacterium 4572_59]